MDRDTFWESMRDLSLLAFKILVAFVILQMILMFAGSDIELPIVHKYMMKAVYWWRDTFGGVRFRN